MKYIYKNTNPKNDRIGDCLCRAITLATNSDYNTVIDLLKKYHGGRVNSIYHIDKVIHDLGFELETYSAYKMLNFNSLIKYDPKFDSSNLIIISENHAACITNNTLYDTWDSSNEKISLVYRITKLEEVRFIPSAKELAMIRKLERETHLDNMCKKQEEKREANCTCPKCGRKTMSIVYTDSTCKAPRSWCCEAKL